MSLDVTANTRFLLVHIVHSLCTHVSDLHRYSLTTICNPAPGYGSRYGLYEVAGA